MQLFLDGEWRDLSEKTEVLNPFDGSVIDTVPSASPAEIAAAIDGLARGAETMRNMPSHRRVEILRKAADLMRERQEELGRLISTEEGKVLAEGRIEAGRAIETIDLSADEARRLRRNCTAGFHPGRGRQTGLHPARTVRHRSGDHPIQLSAQPRRAQDRPGDRRRQRRAAQAGLRHPAFLA